MNSGDSTPAIVFRHGRYSWNSTSNTTLTLLYPPVSYGFTTAVYYGSILKKSRLVATPTFHRIDDVVAHLLVYNEDLYHSVHAVLANHSHRSFVVGSDDELPSAGLVTVIARLPSCCTPARFASTPPLPGKYFLYFSRFLQCLPPSASQIFVSRVGFDSPTPSARPSYTSELCLVLS